MSLHPVGNAVPFDPAKHEADMRKQKRYEIAKAVLAAAMPLPRASFDPPPVQQAVRWADALLAELEK